MLKNIMHDKAKLFFYNIYIKKKFFNFFISYYKTKHLLELIIQLKNITLSNTKKRNDHFS